MSMMRGPLGRLSTADVFGGEPCEMFVLDADLQRVLRQLMSGSSVELLGTRWSGRTEILRRAHTSLSDEGYRVVVVRAVAKGLPLEAVRLALPEEFRAPLAGRPPTVTAVVDALISLADVGSVVILVDDADLLDDPSWFVLETLHKSIGTPILAVTLKVPESKATHRLSQIAHPVSVLELSPLAEPVTSDLVESRLDGPITHDLAAQIHTRSAGIPGGIVAISDSIREAHQLTKRDGRWAADGQLWTRELTGAFAALLKSYSSEDRNALELLSLAGVTDLEMATQLVGSEQLEALEEMDLVRVFRLVHRTMIAVNPPGISLYYLNRAGLLRRQRITEQIRETLGVEELQQMSELLDGFSSTPSDPRFGYPRLVDLIDIPTVTRMFSEQHASNTAAKTHAWQNLGDAASARELLLHMLRTSGATGPDLEEAVGRLDSGPADPRRREVMILDAYLRSRAANARHAPLEEVKAPLKGTPAVDEDMQLALDALGYLADMERNSIPHDFEATLIARSRGYGLGNIFSRLALAAGYIFTGKGGEALQVLDAVEQELPLVVTTDPMGETEFSEHLPRLTEYLRGLALLSTGRFLEAIELSFRSLLAAVSALDHTRLVAQAYVGSMALMVLSRFDEAAELAGLPARIGASGALLVFPPDGAFPTVQALLALSAGRLASADERAAFAATMPEMPALPGGTLRWLTPFRLSRSNRSQARTAFEELAESLEFDNFIFAADIARINAALVTPRVPETPETLASLARCGGKAYPAYQDVRVGVEQKDPDQVMKGVRELRDCGALPAALSYVSIAARLFREQGRPSDAAEARQLGQSMSSIGVAAIQLFQAGTEGLLTSRETSIARLIGSGLTNHEIAERLVISPRTVESHINKIRRKTGVVSRHDVGTLIG